MSAAGSGAMTANAATRLSAAKISARTASTGVKHRMHRAAIGSPRRWKIRDSSALMLFCGRICQWDFRISKLKDGDLAVHWCWNSCFIIWLSQNIRYISEKQYILIICWICFKRLFEKKQYFMIFKVSN